MRILCVVPEYPPHSGGGMLLYYRTLLPELVRLGHQVCVVVAAPFSPPFAAYHHDGIAVECVPEELIHRQAEQFAHLGAAPHLRRYLGAAWAAWEYASARHGCDVVEVPDWGLLFAPWIAEEGTPAVSVTLHGSAGQIDLFDPRPGAELEGIVVRLLEAALLSGADELVTYARSNARAWESILGRNVSVVRPPFRAAGAAASAEAAADAEGLVVARIQHWKGPQVLCQALPSVRAPIPTIRWVGRDMPYGRQPSMSAFLRERYPDVWGSRVVPVGPRSPEETTALQERAAFVVVPSLWDVFNLTLAEALGCGKVAVVSDAAGASELVTHGVDGLVFSSGSAADLCSALERVVAMSAAERREMGRQGQLLIERELDPARIAAVRAAGYADVVGRRARPRQRLDSEWVREAVRPRSGSDGALDFLDHIAVRDLSAHVGARILGRVRGDLATLAAAVRGVRTARHGR